MTLGNKFNSNCACTNYFLPHPCMHYAILLHHLHHLHHHDFAISNVAYISVSSLIAKVNLGYQHDCMPTCSAALIRQSALSHSVHQSTHSVHHSNHQALEKTVCQGQRSRRRSFIPISFLRNLRLRHTVA